VRLCVVCLNKLNKPTYNTVKKGLLEFLKRNYKSSLTLWGRSLLSKALVLQIRVLRVQISSFPLIMMDSNIYRDL
jgi:hypothetical protein